MFGKKRFFNKETPRTDHLPDGEILTLFQNEPGPAWDLFIERYADFIFTQVCSLGFDYDEAMNRFVYVCEKLSEDNFRRMRSVRHLGEQGELIPWLRTVVKNLCINWAWSKDGRRRLFKSITELPTGEQKIFDLYFWKGFTAAEVFEYLRLDGQPDLKFNNVLDSLERIFSVLGQKNLWRLSCNLARRIPESSLDEIEEETGRQPADERADAEETLLRKETLELIAQALAGLSVRERLAVRLHYVEKLSIREAAEVLGISDKKVRNALKTGLRKLRRELK